MDRSISDGLNCGLSAWDVRGLHFEPPPLYFVHIQKTAGTAFGEYLKGIYAPADILHIGQSGHLARQTLATLRGYRCYHCHYGWGLYELVGRSDLLGMTLLRDPVERAISHVYHLQRILVSYPQLFTPDYRAMMHPFLQADLRTCVNAPGFFRILDNWQTRTLGIARDYRPYLQDGLIGARGEQLLSPNEALPLTAAQTLGDGLTTAQQRLDSLGVVGVTERFADSIALLSALLGMPPPTQLPIANVSPTKRNGADHSYRATTPPDLIECIEALNRYDLELYAYACERFAQQFAHQQAQPRRSYSIAPRLRQQAKYWLPLVKKATRRAASWLARSERLKQLYRRSPWFKIR